jgi:hypothetical protein
LATADDPPDGPGQVADAAGVFRTDRQPDGYTEGSVGNLATLPLHHLANLGVVRGGREFQEHGRAVRILGRDVDLAESGVNVALLPVVDPDGSP